MVSFVESFFYEPGNRNCRLGNHFADCLACMGVNHYRDNALKYKGQRDQATSALTLANNVISDMQVRQRDVAALDAKYTGELADAKAN
jgi:hypothetical protein